MDVTLMYFDGCPNWKTAAQHLEQLAAEHPDLHLTTHRVDTVEDAERVGFHGSPSILIDGVDAFADAHPVVGLACRIYHTPDGHAGSPTLDQLRAALERR